LKLPLLSRCTASLALAALLTLSIPALADATHARKPGPQPQNARAAKRPLTGEDVVATVEGQPITRRQLTYYWLQVDRKGPSALLADLLADRWKADKGASRAYTIPDSEIYARLYTGNDALVADVLSSLITNRLVAIEAARKGIRVTQAEARAYAHEFFDQVRRQSGIQDTDEQLMQKFHLPRDVFLDDMLFRLRTEKLLAADLGHPIPQPDWKQYVESHRNPFLAALRKKAKITSTIPLPAPEKPIPQQD